MEFALKHNTAEKTRGACQVIIVSQPRKLSASGQRVDKAGKGMLSAILKRGDMEGKLGQTLLLTSGIAGGAQRLLLVGCGKESEMNERNFARVINAIVSALSASGARDAEICAADIPLKGRDLAWKVRQAVLLLGNSEYRFERLKSGKKEARNDLRKVSVNVTKGDAARAR
jgi:leucyl aminopeptidase